MNNKCVENGGKRKKAHKNRQSELVKITKKYKKTTKYCNITYNKVL